MVLIATLMFVVYNNIPYICVLAGLPFLLLIVNGQKKTAVIYGSLFVLAVIAKLYKGHCYSASTVKRYCCPSNCIGLAVISNLYDGLLHHKVYESG